jgi:hypothetical protein
MTLLTRIIIVQAPGQAPKCPHCGWAMGKGMTGHWWGHCFKCKTPFEVRTEQPAIEPDSPLPVKE